MKFNVNINKHLNVISPFGVRDRKSANNRITESLFKKGKQTCFWCKCAVSLGGGKDYHATADHVYSKNDIRRALDGSIVLACRYCNQLRNDKETHELKMCYNKMSFDFLSQYCNLEYLLNGHLKINGSYEENFFEEIRLSELVTLALIK